MNEHTSTRGTRKKGESVEEYITVLYELLETCHYWNLRDKMLHDCQSWGSEMQHCQTN